MNDTNNQKTERELELEKELKKVNTENIFLKSTISNILGECNKVLNLLR